MQDTLAASAGSLDQMAVTLEATDQYRVLRRFNGRTLFNPLLVPDGAAVGIVLDTETTGRDPETDRIIELGMVSFAFDRETGRVLSALETFNALEDPGMPIPEDAARVNGITDEMVRGHRIDDAAVQMMVEMADMVIAHNSGFDRAFCERRFPFFKSKPWACSRMQVDWEGAGISSAKLEFIAYKLGFYYDAHRAENDCLALLNALNQPLEALSGQPPLAQVLAQMHREDRRIWAVAAPFDAKDVLKARGYRWSGGEKPGTEKAWWTEVPLDKFEEEMDWLRASVYGNRPFSVPVDRIDAFSRFSERRDRLERAYR